MTESTYKALQRAHPHSTECRFTEPCHFRFGLRKRARCACLSDCGFRADYEDCPFRLTDAEVERNIQEFPIDPNYAEVHR
jgi:hypothetical protein